jgi:hypothetical protein
MENMGLIFLLSYACINASLQTYPAWRTHTIFLYIKHLLLSLLDFLNDLPLTVIFEAASRDLIQSQDLLVWVLDKHVLAFWSLETHISDGSDNTPPIGEREIHL